MLAYEDLKGSAGRQMFFRPKRYAAKELFSGAPPRVLLGGSAFRLSDISLTGIAVTANQSVDVIPEQGDVVAIEVHQAGISLLESRARVVRAERHAFGSTLALNLIDGVVDFQLLLRRNAQARISQQLATLDPLAGGNIPAAYRAHCADVLRFLRSYRAIIDASTRHLAGQGSGLSATEAYAMCEERIIPQWRTLWKAGNQIVEDIGQDRKQFEAVKEFTELVLTPELTTGPVWWRSYHKPAGYPGDYEIMNYVYDWQREGSDVHGQLMHRLGLDVAECIATRMHVVRKAIGDVIRSRSDGEPVRILSLGCGSAREVQLHLEDPDAPDAPVVFTLIDQEENALAFAYDRAHPLTLGAKTKARVQALNVSFTEVLRGGKWLDDTGTQDLIYSVGLLDYLVDKRARALTERLYDRLKPGGLLIIGNMNATELSNYWPMEFITDWHLFYRNDPEMLAWTQGMVGARAWTETEPTGRVRLLYVRKPE